MGGRVLKAISQPAHHKGGSRIVGWSACLVCLYKFLGHVETLPRSNFAFCGLGISSGGLQLPEIVFLPPGSFFLAPQSQLQPGTCYYRGG